MLTLKLDAAPYWLDVAPGARVYLRPMCSAFLMRAQQCPAVIAAVEAENQPAHAVALLAAILEPAIIEWEGIGDLDGNPIAPSLPAITALVDTYEPYRVLQDMYLAPWLVVSDEKKGSAPSLNGTSAAAQNTVGLAPPSAPNARAKKTRRRA